MAFAYSTWGKSWGKSWFNTWGVQDEFNGSAGGRMIYLRRRRR